MIGVKTDIRLSAGRAFAVCEAKHLAVWILNQGAEPRKLKVITVCSARRYVDRSRKSPKLLHSVKHAVESVVMIVSHKMALDPNAGQKTIFPQGGGDGALCV